MGDLGALDQLEGQLLVVEGEGEDGAGRRPGADHEVVDGHLGWLCESRWDDDVLVVVVVVSSGAMCFLCHPTAQRKAELSSKARPAVVVLCRCQCRCRLWPTYVNKSRHRCSVPSKSTLIF